jgi:hypothetical protein
MSIDTEQRIGAPHTSGSAISVAGAINIAASGEVPTIGHLLGEGAEPTSIANITVPPTYLYGSNLESDVVPTPVVLVSADAVDTAKALEPTSAPGTVQQVAINNEGAAEAIAESPDPGVQQTEPALTSTAIDPRANVNDETSGWGGDIAQQFDLLIAGQTVDETTSNEASLHEFNGSDEPALDIGGHDFGGLDLGGARSAVSSISVAAFQGEDDPLSGSMTSDNPLSPATLSQITLPEDILADWNASESAVNAIELAQSTSDGALAAPSQSNAEIAPNGIPREAPPSIEGESTSAALISSGAAFWTVAVDRLDGSGPSSAPGYTAGSDLPVASLAAAHLDQLHNLATVLGGH